jgi:8-oxo-dGTP diphosphatase
MPIETLGGSVVYAEHEGSIYLALVHDVFGHWTLSKGKLDPAVSREQATVNKIKQEIGLDIILEDELAMNEYVASHPEKGKVRKQVSYFLGRAEYQPLTLEKTGGLDQAKWFELKDIAELNFYNDIIPIVTKALAILHGRNAEKATE